MTDAGERRPHASVDAQSRATKAMKIERLLSTVCRIPGSQVLEVGTGAGYIAAYFAGLVAPGGSVDAVDVLDQRQVTDGFRFQLVADTTLPFADATFDVRISNHVMEHVGDKADQTNHLREIRRVLKANGWLYLAVPNRWTLVEPHLYERVCVAHGRCLSRRGHQNSWSGSCDGPWM